MKYCKKDNMTKFTGVEYIKLAACSAAGKDKLTWEERLDWFDSNEEKISQISYLNELKDNDDEPYQFKKALYALQDAREGKPTGYAMGLDMTASGVQIFAALSGCPTTAKAVNMVHDGIRHDLYRESGNILGMEHIPRISLKEAIMQYFYSSVATPRRVFGGEVDRFYDLMQETLPGAYDVMEVLKSCQSYIKDSYQFKAPCGSNVLIRQKIVMEHKIRAELDMEDMDNWYAVQAKKEFGMKPKDRSIPANVAHACDGWIVRQVIKACNKLGFHAYHCHDKYFCSPNHMNTLRIVMRGVLAELCNMDFMTQTVRAITGIEDYEYTKITNDLSKTVSKADYIIT